jgi:hypothetical protein
MPCLAEAGVVGAVSHWLLGLPWLWSLMLGCVLAAVSPAVVVPCLLSLQDRGFGVQKVSAFPSASYFRQCCGSGFWFAWIRITLKGMIRICITVISCIRIRNRVISWIRMCINLQMTSLNVWNMSLFEHLFKVLSLYLEARIRIRIKVKSRIRIRMKVKGRIRIRIKVMHQGDEDP